MSTSTPTRAQPPASSPRRRAGAHRTGGGFVGALIPSALAVAAVASLITALAVWQGEAPDQPRAAASSAQEQSSRPEPTPTPSPSGTASESAASESAAGESSPSSEPTASEPVTRDLEVVVLNQTSRRGLAGSVADALRAEGWDVYAVGNFRGVVPDTTVYHPEGAEAEALAVARDLPTDPRVKPRFGNLSTTRLTVVVTDSYPGG